jgi:hypothetical protein
VSEPLDELYLRWLYSQVADPDARGPSRSYWTLLKQMYETEFFWYVPNDDNRAADGQYLRREFIEDLGLDDVDPDWMHLGCSMLELLIGLSRRLSFLDEGEPRGWFWHLVDNLGLRFDDRNRRNFPAALVYEVLQDVMWRTYKPNGHGGIFPLRHPERDQREVELWYQMSSYLLERS